MKEMKDLQLDDERTLDWVYENENPVGFFYFHKSTRTGERCGGYIPVSDHYDDWHIKEITPLTIIPSINCTECDDHGFVEEDSWWGSGQRRPSDFRRNKKKKKYFKKLRSLLGLSFLLFLLASCETADSSASRMK